MSAGSRGFPALLAGACAVFVLDGLYATVIWALREVPVRRVFQGVAAGLLGRDAAVAGGWSTFALGLALHFVNAFLIVGAYHLASRRLPSLTRRPVVYGLLYGIATYFVMNFVVIPLSAIDFRLPPLSSLVRDLAAHAVLVGLPSAFSARAPRR